MRRQTYTNWDIIIVDGSLPNPCIVNKSINDILTRLKTEGHDVIFVREEIPQGVCQARNLAIESDFTGNQFICRIDEDSISNPDYLEKLVKMMEDPTVGAAGGVVPLYGSDIIYRDSSKINVINKIILDENGNVLQLGDECWAGYIPDRIIPTHHLRSSFIFRREVLGKIKEKFGFGGFATDYSKVGFREESDFCLKVLSCGYKMLVDTSAINFHLQAASGGTRHPDYNEQVIIADDHFRRKIRFWHKRGILPKELYGVVK